MRRWNVSIEIPAQQDIADAYEWLWERDPQAAARWFNRRAGEWAATDRRLRPKVGCGRYRGAWLSRW